VLYALSLLEAVDLTDKTYARQLKAAALLENCKNSFRTIPAFRTT
jgi:hypothetical protein